MEVTSESAPAELQHQVSQTETPIRITPEGRGYLFEEGPVQVWIENREGQRRICAFFDLGREPSFDNTYFVVHQLDTTEKDTEGEYRAGLTKVFHELTLGYRQEYFPFRVYESFVTMMKARDCCEKSTDQAVKFFSGDPTPPLSGPLIPLPDDRSRTFSPEDFDLYTHHVAERYYNYLQKEFAAKIVPREEKPLPVQFPDCLDSDIVAMRETMHERLRERVDAVSQLLPKSDYVVLAACSDGIGDQEMSLRFAQTFAKLIHKPVKVLVNPTMAPICEDTPECEYVQHIDVEEMEQHPDAILINLSLLVPHDQQVLARFTSKDAQNPNKIRDFYTTLEMEKRMIGAGEIPLEAIQAWISQVEARDHQPNTYRQNTLDMNMAAFCNLLGLGFPQENVYGAHLPKEHEPVIQDIDVVVVADAKGDANNHSLRYSPDQQKGLADSAKSLEVDHQWSYVFSHLPPSSVERNLVVVRGVSHPEYCDEVIEAAQKFAPENWNVQVFDGSLREFVRLVRRTKVLITVDTGTAHIGNQVAIEEQTQGKNITVLEFYGESNYPLASYGIRGIPPGQGAILVSSSDVESPWSIPPTTLSAFANRHITARLQQK